MSILEAKFMKEYCDTIDNMYRLGWDERNGGNLSYILLEDEIKDYIDLNNKNRFLPLTEALPELEGKYFLVTGTGKYFKNVKGDPETNLGIIKIAEGGKGYYILWGYKDGGRPTSEIPAHLMCHLERLKKDPQHRVVMHTHATNVIAMTFVHSLDERAFTKTLWQMITECLVVFPDGVGVLPWMICGNDEIARATREKMKEYRLCVWGQHGIFGTGKDLDETFGLIETVEKAAEIYMKICGMPILQNITDEELKSLAVAFNLKVKEGWLD